MAPQSIRQSQSEGRVARTGGAPLPSPPSPPSPSCLPGPYATPVTVATTLPSVELQHAWFELERLAPWRTMGLVPGDAGDSTLALAHVLAKMASIDPRRRVLVVNATSEPYDPTVADDWRQEGCVELSSRSEPVRRGRYWDLDFAGLRAEEADVTLVRMPELLRAIDAGDSPFNTCIVAVEPPLRHPTALPVVRALDTAVLCVFLGRTHLARARHTMALIGEGKLAGSIAIRPRRRRSRWRLRMGKD